MTGLPASALHRRTSTKSYQRSRGKAPLDALLDLHKVCSARRFTLLGADCGCTLGTTSSSLEKRPSLAVRAKKWASEMKQAATTVRPAKKPTDDSKVCFGNKLRVWETCLKIRNVQVEVVPTPLEAMKNPFAPQNGELPQTSAGFVPDAPPSALDVEPAASSRQAISEHEQKSP